MSQQRTFIIIKPDAVSDGHVGEILTSFEAEGFSIDRMELVTFSMEQIEHHYGAHKGRPFYEPLVEFMTASPSVKLILSGEDVIARSRALMGPTDSRKAEPGTIRAKFGTDAMKNAIHGSDSPETAEAEIAYFFA